MITIFENFDHKIEEKDTPKTLNFISASAENKLNCVISKQPLAHKKNNAIWFQCWEIALRFSVAVTLDCWECDKRKTPNQIAKHLDSIYTVIIR